MTRYEEIVQTYKKRQRDTLIDAITTGLTYVDELAVDAGILEEAGLLEEIGNTLTGILPFAVIAVSEGSRIILGKKTIKTAGKDLAFRMAKSGAAMGAGAVVLGAAGALPAIPVSMGVRALFDRYKIKALTGRRVSGRIERLKEIRNLIQTDRWASDAEMQSITEKSDIESINTDYSVQ